jgi:hypothetical protein
MEGLPPALDRGNWMQNDSPNPKQHEYHVVYHP